MSAALWTAKEAALATGGRSQGDWEASGVSIDSRSVAAGDLFVALKGPSFDGHDYVSDALGKGAAAAMVSKALEALASDAPLLRVGDTLEALTALGQAARTRSQARFIGVTGSCGKTGTKEALKACLAAQGATAASVASFNNHWGVPLSLARMAQDSAYGVFEVGMNHPGEISALTAILRPHVAIITTIEPVHLEYFESVEAIADAKAEIFESMGADGTAVLNRDNAFYEHLADRARASGVGRIIGFGTAAGAELRLESCDLGERSSEVRAEVFGRRIDYRLGLPGQHSVMNSLAVLGAVEAAGADLDKAMLELAKLEPLKGRGARAEIALPGGGSFELIDDSYNANPSSLRAAIAVLGGSRPETGGRRIAVLGDMLELGTEAKQLHAGLAGPIAEAGVDLVFSCGPLMAALSEALPQALRGGHASDSQALAPEVLDALGPGDIVLVKGSLGSRMAVVVEALKGVGGTSPQATAGK